MSKDKPQPMKWDGNTVLKFLDIYEKYDILWNTAEKNIYSKRAERDVAFKRLVRELYKNGFKIPNEKSLKKKIKNLKDTYKLELNKINESRIIGDEESGVHKPKLVWFKRAHAFMGNPAGKESASSNTSTTIQRSGFNQTAEAKNQEACIVEISTTCDANESDLLAASKTMQITENIASAQSANQSKRNEKTIDEPPRKVQRMENPQNTTSKSHEIAEVKSVQAEDQYSIFSHHIATQLRQLPIKNFVILQEKIQSLITEERLAAMAFDHLPQSPSTYPVSPSTYQSYFFPNN